MPQSNVVKLVYCFGYGASGIENNSPLDGKLLLLEGEGAPPPQQLIMPAKTCIKDLVKCPSEVAFLQELMNDSEPRCPLFSKRDAPEDATERIILLAPISAYNAIHIFEEKTCAKYLYKHTISLLDQTEKWLIHPKTIIQASMVRHTTSDIKPYPPIWAFLLNRRYLCSILA